MSLNKLRDTTASDIGSFVRYPLMGNTIKSCVDRMPNLYIDASIQPITRRILRVTLHIEVDFEWVVKIHGQTQSWYIWIEDPENDCIYHSEHLTIERKSVRDGPQTMAFTIPIGEPLPVQCVNNTLVLFRCKERLTCCFIVCSCKVSGPSDQRSMDGSRKYCPGFL